MKALTLTQPWATLVAIGAKRIETRSWFTNFCGPLAIHSAKNFPKYFQRFCFENPFVAPALFEAGITTIEQLPLGSILAIGELGKCWQIEDERKIERWKEYGVALFSLREFNGRYEPAIHHFKLDEKEMSFGDYTIGRYLWFLKDMNPLEAPIPAKGKLGLWEWDQS